MLIRINRVKNLAKFVNLSEKVLELVVMKNIIPVFDGHNDTLTEFFKSHKDSPKDFLYVQKELDIDLPRAEKGGMIGGLFGIFTPPPQNSVESKYAWGLTITKNGYVMKIPSPLDPSYAKKYTDNIIGFAYEIEKEFKNRVKIVKTTSNIDDSYKEKKISVILHIEGAECINSDLSNLEDYYLKGVRSIGPVWSRQNVFGNGVPFAFPKSPDTGLGLTKQGLRLVRACNRLGIMVDLAHMNLKGFFDVAKVTNKPLVVSHAGVYKICPSTRNLKDQQLKEISVSNGLVGIIFEPINTRPDGKMNEDTQLDVIAGHIMYVAEKYGVDHVAFGSDFDGAQTPKEMKDISKVQNLVKVLKEKGVNSGDLEKIAYKNWFRVIKDTWKN
jgi:membrane dipeptidase